MDTTKLTHCALGATAILIGSVLTVAPITAHASEAAAATAVEAAADVRGLHGERGVRFQVPTGPDIGISARTYLPWAIEAHGRPSPVIGAAAQMPWQPMDAGNCAGSLGRDPAPAERVNHR